MRKYLLRVGRNDRIRNYWGLPIPCCWSDCWKDASTRFQHVIPHDQPERPGDTLTYAFCSDEHKVLWMSATIPGMHGRNLGGQRSPLGLIVP